MSSILNQLNSKQKEAAEQVDGALLILAGAGSGKTRTITYRIAHMVTENLDYKERWSMIEFNKTELSLNDKEYEFKLVGYTVKEI